MNDLKKLGWVRLYRKSLYSSVNKNPIIWWVWCWCLMKANHQENKFPFNGKDIIVKQGQFITGREKACLELKLTPQKYRTAINYLKSTSRIDAKSTNQFSLITIKKWEKYQYDNQQTNQQTNQRITNEQPTDNQRITTNKKDKNIKNDNKAIVEASSTGVISNLLEDKQKHIQIIGLWAKAKKINFTSREHQQSFIKRNLKAAVNLKPYDFTKIMNTMAYLMKNVNFKSTLESVGKYIDEDLSNLNKSNIVKI